MIGYDKSRSLDKFENFVISVDHLYREGELTLDSVDKMARKLLEQKYIE